METRQNKSRGLSIEAFNKADLRLQGDEAIHFGEYFDTIYGIDLYYYNGFIVQTYYNVNTNQIDGMKAITISEAADKFIPLAELFSTNQN